MRLGMVLLFANSDVYAPYIPFYTTPEVTLDDFISRKGMATQYGKKKVNGNFFGKGLLTSDFSP